MVEDVNSGVYIPKFVAPCKKCGLCLNVCPGYFIDYYKLNMFTFDTIPKNLLIGNFINCFRGHSLDEQIRWNASSGGLVTALLIFALKNDLIDGVLVTKVDENNPLRSKPFIARTIEEICSTLGSKYAPVPVNEQLKHILHQDGRFAVVGLPCHIQGIRKAEIQNPKLQARIVLHLGLFCYHNVNFQGYECALKRYGIQKDDITKINYRGNGWPGRTSIKLKSKKEVSVSHLEIFGHFSYFFTPLRCLVCTDQTSELADLSFGDAWLPEVCGIENKGESIVISRTQRGESLLVTAIKNRIIRLSRVSSEKTVLSQKAPLLFKKRNFGARTHLLAIINKRVPLNNSPLVELTSLDFLSALLSLLTAYISSSKLFRFIFPYIPQKIMFFYRMAHKKLLSMGNTSNVLY